MLRYSDYKSTYGDAVNFTNDVEITDAEFLRVRCYAGDQGDRLVYTNFHAVGQLKPHVERHCDEALERRLRGRRGLNEVYNVLLVGVDSTSRLNSIRRLKSTRKFLLEQLDVN